MNTQNMILFGIFTISTFGLIGILALLGKIADRLEDIEMELKKQ